MKIGIITGIVAIVLVFSTATIFLMSKNNKVVDTPIIESAESNVDTVSQPIIEERIENIENEEKLINEVEPTDNKTVDITKTVSKEVIKEPEVVKEPVNETIETVVNNVVIPDESVGMLKIPSIDINTPVLEGHSLEVLAKGLGHFDDTAYWQGNIGILGHNYLNKSSGHFKKLEKVALDDEISYTTEYGTRTYKVSEIKQIAEDDWSVLANTNDNRITLITCVRNVPSKRLCVIAKEI